MPRSKSAELERERQRREVMAALDPDDPRIRRVPMGLSGNDAPRHLRSSAKSPTQKAKGPPPRVIAGRQPKNHPSAKRKR